MTRILSLKTYRGLATAAATVALAASCSLVNSFDEVAPEDTTGDGDGDASGGTDMGGNNTGGADGMGGDDSGSGGTPDGTGGGSIEVEPGLIVAFESDGLLPTDPEVLWALSPQDGSELARLEGQFETATYEPKRDLWFLVRNGRLTAARFDRAKREWDFLTDMGPEVPLVARFTRSFFALNERLAVKEGTMLNVYDTSDPEDIKFIDGVEAYPTVNTRSLWGSERASKTIGGDVIILTKDCTALSDVTCPVTATSVAITLNGVQVRTPEIIVPDFDNSGPARGNLRYDVGSQQLVIVIPNATGGLGASANALLYSPDTLVAASAYTFQQTGNQLSQIEVDPCHTVAYMTSPGDANVSELPLTDEMGIIPKVEPVNIPGSPIVYEPHTRSMILFEAEGIHAFEIIGTPLAPDLKKRIVGWTPPTINAQLVITASVDSAAGCQ